MGKSIVHYGLAAALLLMTPPVRSGAPPYIPVQGFLTDAQGLALNESVDIRFAIYDDATAGTELWAETQNVAVEEGFFVAYLGQAVTLELSMFKAFDTLWLGISVGSDPEMERMTLGSVPFSGFSAHSSYIGAGGVYISDQNVISADLGNSVESIEITDGTIASEDIGFDTITSGHITDGTIGAADIGSDEIGSAHISDGSVGSDDIADGAVTTSQIQDGTILPEDLSPGIVPRVDWDPVDINLAQLRFSTGTSTIDLPAEIPAGAKEILVYVWYENGVNGPDARFHYRIYTQAGSTQYAMKFLGRSYNNPAWTFNSDNFWLPVTAERKLYVELNGDITGNRLGEIHLLGYR